MSLLCIRSRLLAALSVITIGFSQFAIACNITLVGGQDIQSALNDPSNGVVCLSSGDYYPAATLFVPNGKSLNGQSMLDTRIISQSNAIVQLSPGSSVSQVSLIGGGSLTYWGVLASQASWSTISSVKVMYTMIGFGVDQSSNVQLIGPFVTSNGIPGDGLASPSIWINSSNDVLVKWGEIFGSWENGWGNGELAAYNSTQVVVDSLYLNRSGAAGIYMVNCDYCRVENSFIRRAGEHGLDFQGGSDYFVARNNEISDHRWGAVLFDQIRNQGGEFTGNSFYTGRWNPVGSETCYGVNVNGNVAAVTICGNVPNAWWGLHREKCALGSFY